MQWKLVPVQNERTLHISLFWLQVLYCHCLNPCQPPREGLGQGSGLPAPWWPCSTWEGKASTKESSENVSFETEPMCREQCCVPSALGFISFLFLLKVLQERPWIFNTCLAMSIYWECCEAQKLKNLWLLSVPRSLYVLVIYSCYLIRSCIQQVCFFSMENQLWKQWTGIFSGELGKYAAHKYLFIFVCKCICTANRACLSFAQAVQY